MQNLLITKRSNKNKISYNNFIFFLILMFSISLFFNACSNENKKHLKNHLMEQMKIQGKNLPPRIPEQIKQKPPLFIVLNSINKDSIPFKILNNDPNNPSYNQSVSIEPLINPGLFPPRILAKGDSLLFTVRPTPILLKVSYSGTVAPDSLASVMLYNMADTLSTDSVYCFYFYYGN